MIVDLSAVAGAAVGAAAASLAAGLAGSPHPATNALVTIAKIAAIAIGRPMRNGSMRTPFVSVGGAIRGVVGMRAQECTLPDTFCHRRRTRRDSSRVTSIALLNEMCHNVHMKTISIRELHLKTGQWVRDAASRGPIVVTDRGRRVAALQPFDASVTGRPLPNREAAIRKRSKVPVDSVVYQSELREDR